MAFISKDAIKEYKMFDIIGQKKVFSTITMYNAFVLKIKDSFKYPYKRQTFSDQFDGVSFIDEII